MGHVQRMDVSYHPQTQQIGLFAGVCYTHAEDYLGPQGNSCPRQILMKHEVEDGRYDLMGGGLASLPEEEVFLMFKNLLTQDQLLTERLCQFELLARKTSEIHRDKSPLALGTHLAVMTAVLRQAEWRLRDLEEKQWREKEKNNGARDGLGPRP